MHQPASPAQRSARASRIVLAASLILGGFAAGARADDFTDKANKPYTEIKQDKRSDLVLLPLLAKMAPPPKSAALPEQAMILPAGKSGWDAAADWAKAAPQQELLKALATVTKETKWREAYQFGLPYGIENVPLELIKSNLYTDLGDPPTLAGARVQYMKAMKDFASLVNIEATRLTAEGKVSDAIDLLISFAYFGRQMCDRQMYSEATWGFAVISLSLERMRDVVYLDAQGPKALDVSRLKDQIARVDERNGYLNLERIKFPVGDRAAAEQLIARMYKKDGSLDEQIFTSTMSRLTSTVRPLRLFSESGKWRSIGSAQGNKSEAQQQIAAVFDDWGNRWKIPMFDTRLANTPPRVDKSRFAMLGATIPDMSTLYGQRHIATVEAVGTRAALGTMGYFKSNGKFPPGISGISPAWVPEAESDPFNPNTQKGAKPALKYFVPIRDSAAFDGPGNPHEMSVVLKGILGVTFKVSLKDDVFVLYSVGSDNAMNNAKNVQNTFDVVQGADFLIWPPVISLARQYRIGEGEFK